MILSAVLFAAAAVGGLIMLAMRLAGRGQPPMPLALLHGLLAAAGLVVLLVVVVTETLVSNFALVSLAGFLLAAFGGFFLFSFHLRKKDLPVPLMALHALFAVGSFGFLIVSIVAG